MSNFAASIFDGCSKALQHVLPARCVLCAAPSDASRFCGACAASLPRLGNACARCAEPLPVGSMCGACIERPPAFDNVVTACAYAFPVDALIHAYKYGGDLTLAPVLAKLLTDCELPGVDAIVAMPLSPSRLRERGFNQAQELARILGRSLRIPVLRDAARRVIETPPQASLPWQARARNVRNAFVCDVDLEGRRIAVVDDVMTTGATLNELARNLKRAGAASVSGWVVARTLRRDAG